MESIIVSFIIFSVGIFSFIKVRNSKINNPKIKYTFLTIALTVAFLYSLTIFRDIQFKGIYTQEIFLILGTCSFFLSMLFGLKNKVLKILNCTTLIIFTPFLHQFLIYIILNPLFGINLYDEEFKLYEDQNSKIIGQLNSPGMSMIENIYILEDRNPIIQNKKLIHSMRYSKDSLKFKKTNNGTRISDVTKDSKFDTVIYKK